MLELPEGVTLEQMMQRLERQLIESTLRRCGNHKDRAAKQLGMARSFLFEKLKDWGSVRGKRGGTACAMRSASTRAAPKIPSEKKQQFDPRKTARSVL